MSCSPRRARLRLPLSRPALMTPPPWRTGGITTQRRAVTLADRREKWLEARPGRLFLQNPNVWGAPGTCPGRVRCRFSPSVRPRAVHAARMMGEVVRGCGGAGPSRQGRDVALWWELWGESVDPQPGHGTSAMKSTVHGRQH
eukprot:gene14908-biopygen2120